MVTNVIKWFWGPPASKMSNSRLSKQGQDVSMQDTSTTAETKLGRTKPSTGPHAGRGPRVGHDLNKLVTVNYTRNMAKFCLYQEKNEHTKRFQKIPNSRFLLCAVNTPVGNTGVEWDANFCWGQQRLIHNTLRHFVLQNCADVCWHQ